MTALTDQGNHKSLIEQDRRFFDALVAGDAASLSKMLADDFILVSISDGAAVTGPDLIAAVSSGALRFPSIRSFPEEAIVRRAGDVGIVVGRTEINFTNDDGSAFAAGSRYTHVFVYGPDSGWRLLSAQGTEIKPAA